MKKKVSYYLITLAYIRSFHSFYTFLSERERERDDDQLWQLRPEFLSQAAGEQAEVGLSGENVGLSEKGCGDIGRNLRWKAARHL